MEWEKLLFEIKTKLDTVKGLRPHKILPKIFVKIFEYKSLINIDLKML